MLEIRDLYRRYSLFVLILGLGVVIFMKLTPFLGGLLGAATIYILLRGQMDRLTRGRGWHRSAAAALLLGEAVLFFLIPIMGIVWMLVVRIQSVSLDPQTLVTPLRHVVELVRERTGYDIWQESNLNSLMALLPRLGQWVVGRIAGLGINIVVLLFVLYFMLIGGHRMEKYFSELLPFRRPVAQGVLREVHMIVRSNAIGVPLLAVIQGFVAFVGYVVFGVPSPFFWGVLTCFATIIPIIGTALVWLPLAGYLALNNQWGLAVGLVLYGGLVVTHVDNLVRFVLQKKLADTHPLVTIFGVVIGLSLFGFMGVIFGPLLLDMFIFCVKLFKTTYLDVAEDPRLFDPPAADPSVEPVEDMPEK